MTAALLLKISRLDANHRLNAALILAVLIFLLVPGPYFTSIHLTLVWIAFALTELVLTWITILVAHPRDLPGLSRLEDSGRLLIFMFVIAAAIASVVAVINLLGSTDKQNPNHQQHVLLAALAVASAWGLVHTIFTLRYAHLYYGNDPKQKKRHGGLDFPHETEPDYLDFAYYSFVVGMTSQVSDVAVGSKIMRRTTLVHGLLSFAFNAIIIALTIGGVSGLI